LERLGAGVFLAAAAVVTSVVFAPLRWLLAS
jgi:hypothetical protein